ncbi:hypothetical protein D8I35_05295 [Corticibacter populi]|uniref:Uncharacterized protein n=1 Tax=Corticibacter populi TaxID=1550736 RepID=A0A3M6QZP5_9BURK|nr:hypothetical protein D8I35_05295 [Corticibacter populi]
MRLHLGWAQMAAAQLLGVSYLDGLIHDHHQPGNGSGLLLQQDKGGADFERFPRLQVDAMLAFGHGESVPAIVHLA